MDYDQVKVNDQLTRQVARLYFAKPYGDGDVEHVIRRIREHFDHAAGIVRIKCQGMPGVDAVLAALRARAGSAETDPRVNRELFLEPWIDAQQLGVPQETAEEVARQLHALSVLRLWTRVKCPEVPPEEDGTIFETDSEQEFRARVKQACPHCGTTHDLVPSQIETVYAPNFPGSGGVTRFDYDRLKPKRKVRKQPAAPGTPHRIVDPTFRTAG